MFNDLPTWILRCEPLVFTDPTDDGPEVDILRGDKVIVRKGDDFELRHINPRVKNRFF